MAPLGRVTCRWYVVGPRPSARDRSAGDSSPVTPRAVGSGDARGRPHPVETVAQAAARPARCKTSRPRSEQPHCQRSIPLVRPKCAGSATLPTRRYPPGAAPRHRRCPDVGADHQGPRGSCIRGASALRAPCCASACTVLRLSLRERPRPDRRASRCRRSTRAWGRGGRARAAGWSPGWGSAAWTGRGARHRSPSYATASLYGCSASCPSPRPYVKERAARKPAPRWSPRGTATRWMTGWMTRTGTGTPWSWRAATRPSRPRPNRRPHPEP